ncbi:MAG: hypothetical protein QM758_21035 [Armatimonas sp.]
MSERYLPVRPDIEQLRHQAKELLQELRANNPESATVKLADAQYALARSYGVSNWPRLKQACEIINAIWDGDIDTVRTMVMKNPEACLPSKPMAGNTATGEPHSLTLPMWVTTTL